MTQNNIHSAHIGNFLFQVGANSEVEQYSTM